MLWNTILLRDGQNVLLGGLNIGLKGEFTNGNAKTLMTDDRVITPVDPSSVEHYEWGLGSEGWRLLTLPILSVIQERVPPGAGETRHFHVRAHQFFYVLSGVATLEFDDARVHFEAGQGVHVPNGVEHRLVNDTDLEVVFLVISSAPTTGDRVDTNPA